MPYWWEWFIWIKSHCHPQVMLCYTSISALSWWPHYQSFIDLATVTAPQGMLAQQMPPSGANFIVSTLLGRTPDHVPICILFRKDEKGRKTGKKSEPTNSWFFFNRYFVFSSKQLSSHSLSLFSTELLNQPLRCHRKLWEEKKRSRKLLGLEYETSFYLCWIENPYLPFHREARSQHWLEFKVLQLGSGWTVFGYEITLM